MLVSYIGFGAGFLREDTFVHGPSDKFQTGQPGVLALCPESGGGWAHNRESGNGLQKHQGRQQIQ